MENFKKGYNCSQSIVLTFADILPLDSDTLSRMASSFGGGMGRLREVCGAVSGMFMVAGLLYGYEGPETGQVKAEHYARIQDLAHKFEEKHRSIVCREMHVELGSEPHAGGSLERCERVLGNTELWIVQAAVGIAKAA